MRGFAAELEKPARLKFKVAAFWLSVITGGVMDNASRGFSNPEQKVGGFTIVELVVVIILLGILAATALPRFIDVDDDAHAAAFQGVLGGYQTGIALYHAQWMADGQPAAGSSSAQFNNLLTTAQGYPYSQTVQAGHVPTVSQDCEDIFVGVLQGGPSISDAPNPAGVVGSTTEYTAERNGANCNYYYTGQSSNSGATIPVFTFVSATGVVTSTTATLP